jgi:hypothetical protein
MAPPESRTSELASALALKRRFMWMMSLACSFLAVCVQRL